MDGIIFNETSGKIIKVFETIRGAKQSFKRGGYENDPNLTVCTAEHYANTGAIKAAEMVEVKNIMTGKMVKIRRSDVGSCCDPSTETYWSM